MRFILLLIPVFIVGCASSYKPLRPNGANFSNTTITDSISFSYRHGVLRETGNKKYAKREDRKMIRVSSVKVTNNTNQPLTIGKDILLYSGSNELVLLEPSILHRELKQGVPEYLLFLLLTPIQLNTGDDSTPIGLFIGPGIAFGNMIGAGSANQNFLKDLKQFNLINKTINPSETVFGLIGVREKGYDPIFLRFKN